MKYFSWLVNGHSSLLSSPQMDVATLCKYQIAICVYFICMFTVLNDHFSERFVKSDTWKCWSCLNTFISTIILSGLRGLIAFHLPFIVYQVSEIKIPNCLFYKQHLQMTIWIQKSMVSYCVLTINLQNGH